MLFSAAVVAALTAGWENVNPERREFPVTETLWAADTAKAEEFSVDWRKGAAGTVRFTSDGIHVCKTNDVGLVVIKAKPFETTVGRNLRFSADESVRDADVNFSSGFLRYHGKKEGMLRMDTKAENKSFWEGGQQTMRGLPCTAPGMTYRKYAQCSAKDGVVTPVLVVAGKASDSVWKNWCAEDLDAATEARRTFIKKNYPSQDRRPTMMDEKEFDSITAGDCLHSAEVRRIDGVSRLLVDGVISAPVLYRASHVHRYWAERGNGSFAGGPFNGSAVKLMVVSTMCWQYCSNNVPDYTLQVRELKEAMRMAPQSYFIIGWSVKAPEDFISKYHPDEGWINENGEPVMGLDNTCVMGYASMNAETAKRAHHWPSPSSPAWRKWVKESLVGFLRELKQQNLHKRVVGVHFFGYHDQQMTMCWIDHSTCAQEEYKRIIAEPDCVSTNYDYCMRLTGQRALNEFARVFKAEMAAQDPGRKTIAIKWSQSPFDGRRSSAMDISDFVRQDALDVIVCQSNYRERLPGFPTVSVLPMESLHLHGKLYLNELDLRTYVRPFDHGMPSVVSMKVLGMSEDFPMWQTIYRRFAGEADASRMGYWFYDMKSGWFEAPEIVNDIRGLASEEESLARLKPSAWRPDVAVLIDEVQILYGDKPLTRPAVNSSYIYFEQVRGLVCSGVPFESYLAEDAFRNPDILKGKKVVIFAFMREIDAKRKALLDQLAATGTTLVFLSETGVKGGAEAIRFKPVLTEGNFGHRMEPEKGVQSDMISLYATMLERDLTDSDHKVGARCTVEESAGVRVLARYVSDRLPAVACRSDADCRRVYVAEPSGLTPSFFNRLSRESGAYVAVDRDGLQLNMNGDFISLHCLRPGSYRIALPDDCRVMNLKSRMFETVNERSFDVTLTAGQSCRFRLLREPLAQDPLERYPLEHYVKVFSAEAAETGTNNVSCAEAYDFMRSNVPILECPDKEIERAYYFRWWSYLHHLKKTPSGYVVTEFLPNVSWAGKYNTINCAAGHHVMEGRWLKNPRYMDDYVRFLMSEGTMSGPRAYVCWLAYAVAERSKLTGDWQLATELLDSFVRNYEAWEKGWPRRPYPYKDPNERFAMGLRANGLFAATDDREGSENSIGGDGQRPLINAAMAGEAKAIATIARRAGRPEIAEAFDARSAALVRKMKDLLWNQERSFFTVLKDDGEHKNVRELFGYSPWYFGLDMKGYGDAWQYVMKTDGFLAPCGLANPEISDPGFVVAYRDLTKSGCRRDGPCWPYETSLVLTALANALQSGQDTANVDANAYLLLLRQYAVAHKLQLDDGRFISWIDENFDPFSGEWVTRRIYRLKKAASFGRGRYYNHSSFCDLVLSGLCGIRVQADGTIDLKPLASKEWDYFRVSNLRVAGREFELVWDRTGKHYERGPGLSLYLDGTCVERRGLASTDGERDETLFKFDTDGERLRFRFEVVDHTVTAVPKPERERDLEKGDRVEVFFSPSPDMDRTYYCIEIDPEGRVLDYCGTFPRKFDYDWRCRTLCVKTERRPDGYSVSGSIAKSELIEMGLDLGDFWMGAFRADFASGGRLVSWSSLLPLGEGEPDFHRPGTLVHASAR